MKELTVAIIGAGGMGQCHGNSYNSVEGVKVVAVVDIRMEKAEELAQKHGARAYSSIDELLLNEHPDFVDVCTPTYLHAEMVIKAANKKIHVLCEKPITINASTAREMIDECDKNGVFLMTAHVIRFWPEYVYLKKIYDDKTFGELKEAFFSRISARPAWSWEDWMAVAEKSGRAPLDLHIHDADYIYYIFGKPDAVKAVGKEEGNSISYIITNYLYKDKVVTAEGAWYEAPIPFSMTFRAVFERAAMEYKDGKLMVYTMNKEPQQITLSSDISKESGINLPATDAYVSEIQYFVDCVRMGTPPEVITPEGTFECLEMVLSEVKSARNGETISLR